MERFAFVMNLLPGSSEEYIRRHQAVWPALLDSLHQAGAHNYSIYRRDSDLFGYLEIEDFDRFRSTMSRSEVNARWQAEMSALIDPLIDAATGFNRRLDELFHLD